MNKRIKLLAEQALIEFMDENEYTNVVLPDLLSQKFAELIVRECAGIACEHMELNEGTDYNIGSKIKQHFGVEE